MGRWLEHSVITEIQAPAERVWTVWSDLEAMPRWLQWIESVKVVPNDPDLTDWTLAAQGFRLHWKARITQRVEAQRPTSSAHQALRHALMTPKEHVPAATRRKLDLFTAPYWGPFS